MLKDTLVLVAALAVLGCADAPTEVGSATEAGAFRSMPAFAATAGGQVLYVVIPDAGGALPPNMLLVATGSPSLSISTKAMAFRLRRLVMAHSSKSEQCPGCRSSGSAQQNAFLNRCRSRNQDEQIPERDQLCSSRSVPDQLSACQLTAPCFGILGARLRGTIRSRGPKPRRTTHTPDRSSTLRSSPA